MNTDDSGRVTYLDLIDSNLRGELPPELGNLAMLGTMYLGGNEFTGQLPPQWETLVNLRVLHISPRGGVGHHGYCYTSDLTGPIPAEWGNLVSLQELELQNNQLTGPLPPEFGNLSNLKEMNLSNNRLSGPLPVEFAKLTARLNLSENRLSGTGPEEIWNSEIHLDLTNNYFTGERPERLRAHRNKYGDWASTRGNYWGREVPGASLRLAEDGTEERARQALVALYHATGGENWKRKENWLTDAPLQEWAGVGMGRGGYDPFETCHGVYRLTLGDNNLTGELPREMGNLTTLRYLDLRDNNLT